ncbi:unnamed protein product [Discula destructiva]
MADASTQASKLAEANPAAAEKVPTETENSEKIAEQPAPAPTPAAPEPATDATAHRGTTTAISEEPAPAPTPAQTAVTEENKPEVDFTASVAAVTAPGEVAEKPATVAAATPAAEEEKLDAEPTAPVAAPKDVEAATLPSKTAFDEFDAKLPEVLKEVGHDEMWGVQLTSPAASHVPTGIVLQKFLNANDGKLAAAVEQFTGALKFRKEKKPLELVAKTFSASKFADLGAVTVYPVKDSAIPEVFTWNLYGNVKGKMDEVFVPMDEFMNYRIALQELGIQQLQLASATEPISAEQDPYKIIQVHDYKSISFLRQNPNVKAASTEVIKKFALAYPELLKEKFFVNVPAIMGWMYAVIKVFIAEKTAKKFHPMANGTNLAAEFKASGMDEKQLPKEYGGDAGSGDGKMKDIPCLVSELRFE